ncbi:unnamed protein product [Cylicocyclus nassatus]|uniref:RRM domain-containing protein n=1 Tax=Cylicocyclus nassatus TaxID=53992 RepID=A0AA36M3X2_CYLNA|nr:unnamed protein product [Cylicocyclus nassatus]
MAKGVLGNMNTQNKGVVKPAEKKEQTLHVVKIKRIPYGLFEKQLWEYFTQFGKVIRVRVARSVKTGNHKGWAYVGFEDKEVAEIAAETMDGYLMFEKRLSCHVMDPKDVPRSMKSGSRYLAPPHLRGKAKKEALLRNTAKPQEQEEKSKSRREASQKKQSNKLKRLGIVYDFGAVPSSANIVKLIDHKNSQRKAKGGRSSCPVRHANSFYQTQKDQITQSQRKKGGILFLMKGSLRTSKLKKSSK